MATTSDIWILNIETSTKNCSVSLAKNGRLIDITEIADQNYSHAEKLHVFIENILKENNLKPKELSAICVGKGPGSYTGLRIGVASAKGLAYASEIPLLSLNSLEILSEQITEKDGWICPMLDARRMEVYTLLLDQNSNIIKKTSAEIIDENFLKETLSSQKIYFLGDGSKKCKEVILSKNAIFLDMDYPSAKDMCKMSFQKFQNKEEEDIAYFEPFYLKDFIVTPQKKKL